jgi:hypothetical protein
VSTTQPMPRKNPHRKKVPRKVHALLTSNKPYQRLSSISKRTNGQA